MSEGYIDYKGQKFESIDAMCSAYNIRTSTYLRRVAEGMSNQNALCIKTYAPKKKYQKVKIRLKTERINANLSQKDIADTTGVSIAAVSAWENGRSAPTKTECETLGEMYHCTSDYLLGLVDDRNNNIDISIPDQKEKVRTRLRKERIKASLYQKDVAEITGMSVASVAAWETSRALPAYSACKKMSEAYGCSADYLMGLTDDRMGKADDVHVMWHERDTLVPAEKSSISKNLKLLRKMKKISQEDMAKMIGITCNRLSRYERSIAYPDAEMISKMAQVLGCSENFLKGDANK